MGNAVDNTQYPLSIRAAGKGLLPAMALKVASQIYQKVRRELKIAIETEKVQVRLLTPSFHLAQVTEECGQATS